MRVRPAALTLALVGAMAAAAPLTAGERELKEQELAKLRESIGALRQELQSTRSRHSALQTELERLERKLGQAAAALRELKGELKRQRSELARLRTRRTALEETLASQRTYLSRQVRAAYAMGRQEYLKILLNQDNPAAVGRVLTYYDYLNRARSERIGALVATLEELASVRRRISRKTDRLQALKAREQAELQQLEASRAARAEVLVRLEQELSTKDARLERMVANEKELEALVDALARALSDIPDHPNQSFTKLQGRLSWPTEGRRVAAFGSPRASGRSHWRGVLIKASQGQEVRAVSHGRVVFAEWLRGYGLLLIVDHGDGYMSLYGHNQSLYKETGDWVEAGEVVASVGDTGGQERTALYFEIRHNGQPTDPARWCRRG